VSTTVFENITSVRQWVTSQKLRGKVIGFVPTMGALHPGHISLISRAKEECDLVVMSIFVNPTQFNNPDDLLKYPRTFERDLELLDGSGCDVVFFPSIKEMYPVPEKHHWDFGVLSNSLEGHFRPGHFDGVLTIVKKFFEIVRPDKAYFGEKDFQQLSLIKAMTAFEELPVEIVSCQIIRENDGLAMSSRNMRLSPEERIKARGLSKALFSMAERKQEHTPKELKAFGEFLVLREGEVILEYLEIVDTVTFIPLESWQDSKAPIVLLAAYVGSIRLIDNLKLG
jgi:pantoate--beta-alanine ligase